MAHEIPSLISDIRSASRALVRQFGLMNHTVAGTDLSLSAVHAIIEIGQSNGLSSKDLSEKLRLEKSSVSRLVKSLVGKGEVREVRSKDDGRMKYLYLTRRGSSTLRAINRFGETQVAEALERLDDRSRRRVLKGLQDYAAALDGTDNRQDRMRPLDRVKIETGYRPAIVGRIVEMQLDYMSEHHGFGAAFEARIAADLAEFMSRIDSSLNEIWRAEIDNKIVGGVSIDGEDLGNGLAHLRWFIVSDEVRGGGVGNALLSQALAFCDRRGYRETQLWTVKGLDAARKLYERHGFELAEEYFGDQWGVDVLEQKFVRPRP